MISVKYRRGSKVKRLQDLEHDFPKCECGHSKAIHYRKSLRHTDLGPCYNSECDCRDYVPMDWITNLCTIPERLNTSISFKENSYDQESPSRRD